MYGWSNKTIIIISKIMSCLQGESQSNKKYLENSQTYKILFLLNYNEITQQK